MEEITKRIAEKTFSIRKASGYVCYASLVWCSMPVMVSYNALNRSLLNVFFLGTDENGEEKFLAPEEIEFLEDLMDNHLSSDKERIVSRQRRKEEQEKERLRLIEAEKKRKAERKLAKELKKNKK